MALSIAHNVTSIFGAYSEHIVHKRGSNELQSMMNLKIVPLKCTLLSDEALPRTVVCSQMSLH